MIARMNALNDLTTEVRFRERMRGYDFEEVDSYVKTVSRAAAQARDQMAELQQRLAQSESHGSDDEGVRETREMLLRTLVLAQRTADAAVSEARAEARSISESAQERAARTVAEAESAASARLRSSEERATQILAEGEENCQLILAEAKRTAAAELATERARKLEEIRALEVTRVELEAAVVSIRARLEDERSKLRSLSVSFQSFVEQFEPVTDTGESEARAGRQLATGVLVPAQPSVGPDGEAGAAMDAGTPSAPVAEAEEGSAAEIVAAPEGSAAEIVAAPEGSTGDVGADSSVRDVDGGQDPETSVGEPVGEPGVIPDPQPPTESILEFPPDAEDTPPGLGAAFEEALAADTLQEETMPDLPAVQWPGEISDGWSDGTDEEPAPEAGAGAGGLEPASNGSGSALRERVDPDLGEAATDAGPEMPLGGADSPELFDVEAEEDDEFIEQLRRVVSSDAPLPDTDAAMAAFFDHDEDAGRSSGAMGRGGRLGPRA